MIIISNRNSVPKKLSFISIYFLGINGVIGSGTFLLPSVIYRYMNLSAVLVLLCTALKVSMIALCYADLASRSTGSGAAWLYAYNAFGRFAGYGLGIFTCFLGCCTLAAEIVALLTTLKSFLPIFNNHGVYYAAAMALIVLFAVINFFGRSIVKLVNNISAVAKMLTLLVFIVIGAFFIHKSNLSPVISPVRDHFSSILGQHLLLSSTYLPVFPFYPLPLSKWRTLRKIFPGY